MLLGGFLGVVVDKIVGDAFIKAGISNPQIGTIQFHDVLLILGELGLAWMLRGRSAMLSNILGGMALAVIITDIYEYISGMGTWF